jgi:hypothetical protein
MNKTNKEKFFPGKILPKNLLSCPNPDSAGKEVFFRWLVNMQIGSKLTFSQNVY